ncbi:40S ribosomal protein eS7 [Aspergillus novofumigatus IBT 16806]|uniref:40S ribosomal protein S7 n=1 Tax=Aspergillus novofumigatus (strain IBT 16806) TaxID=1392255 RepID=A0A2I1C379_ASPN1|nr:ribosomal protein S7e [Aspergillus novofumigatus IBT 16806]PKX92094.1 ribosomal protein S7e [Aspergillus novofumigatus IBT 16806]
MADFTRLFAAWEIGKTRWKGDTGVMDTGLIRAFVHSYFLRSSNTVLQVEVGHGKKAVIIFVPVPLLQGFHKIQQRLTRELEKKFSDRHVLFVAQRRILPRPKRSVNSRTNQKQKRPRSRTLTAVHDAILNDLVYPVEIVGKRIRTKEDGSKTLKVILDEKERGGVDHRLDAYGEVYRRLTGRSVVFEFPQSGAAEY